MPKDDAEQLQLVRRYRQLVERYEEKDRAIDELIMRHGGSSQNMSAAAREEYRRLAEERLELLNQMRQLEQQLDIDVESSCSRPGANEE